MTVPDEEVLLDANILVYVYDRAAGDKHRIAAELVSQLAQSGRLILSVQALNEFFSVTLRRQKVMGIDLAQAASIVSNLADVARVLPITSSISKLAIDAVVRHSISFWDALVWASAFENGIHTLLSEDFQTGRELQGVRFVNPFAQP
jgi:predicted nucleic acid-binding protein